jgi:septation ring formation regulator EzrA
MGTESKKASKLERKVALLHEGYRTRSVALSKKLKTLHDELVGKKNTLRAFELLEAKESLGAPIRVEKAMELAEAAREKEKVLQEKYAAAVKK